MQILLVEDDRPLAQGLQKALQNRGYTVNHVTEGKAALHVIKTERPDILVLDIGLPDISGLKILRQLRSKQDMLPVLLLTARDSIDDKVAGLDSGADDYLPKPFEMTELFARLRVLERRLASVKSSAITIGDVCLDILSRWLPSKARPLSCRDVNTCC